MPMVIFHSYGELPEGNQEHVGHGQCLIYSSWSSTFEECIVVFSGFSISAHVIVFGRLYYRFARPSSIPKNKDVSNTTLHYIN